jgi:hypothetical protein
MEQILVILLLGAIIGVVRWVYREYIADTDIDQNLEEKKEQSRLVDLKLKKYARIFIISMILFGVIYSLYLTF